MSERKTQAPAEGDEMLEPLIYAAMMHNGKPKTLAEFERAAANVADMLQRRAEVTHEKPVASIYISADGSREFDDWRVELPPGNHQLFTAPRSAQPQPESLPHPGTPEAEEMIDKLLAEHNRPANMKNAARAGYMAARRLLQLARTPLPNVQPKGTVVAYRALKTGALMDAAEVEKLWPTAHDRVKAMWAPLVYATPDTQAPAPAQQGGVDCIGLALDLEARAKTVGSQTTERAMKAAAHGLRLLAASRAPAVGAEPLSGTPPRADYVKAARGIEGSGVPYGDWPELPLKLPPALPGLAI